MLDFQFNHFHNHFQQKKYRFYSFYKQQKTIWKQCIQIIVNLKLFVI